MSPSLSLRLLLPLLVFLGGVAALAWELLWQHHASLALGVSAEGTAITLATTMGGMTLGAIVAGNLLERRRTRNPLRLYAWLEGAVGVFGLLLSPCFKLVAAVDTSVYQMNPSLAPAIHLMGLAAVLGAPAIAMGATLPVIGLIAQQHRLSLARLYAFNTAGAAAGVCLLAFAVLPTCGVILTTMVIAAVNLSVLAIALRLAARPSENVASPKPSDEASRGSRLPMSFRMACGAVLITGFATFALEIAWFRSIMATFFSTTDAFALILFSVLISLAIGARLAHFLRKTKLPLVAVMFLAGCLILLATPLVERFDSLAPFPINYWNRIGGWLGLSLAIMGPPMVALGVALPWILDTTEHPRQWGVLYGINTIGAILGATLTAWVLLPTIGFIHAAWFAGALVCTMAIVGMSNLSRIPAIAIGVVCLLVAMRFDSGAGYSRAYGRGAISGAHRLIDIHEGPNVTTAVIERPFGRVLLIDGFAATSELKTAAYMDWMGRLPMLLHPDPQTALVIAFGTGQTAHGVVDENPASLDIVDINSAVYKMARHFESNHGVLNDPRVRHLVMDGRAWLRRTKQKYDVVTLEPMPPHFAGVNALYSQEFYELMTGRLNDGAIVAQWLPIHIVRPEHAIAISAAFGAVFPECLMWKDPTSDTIILLGRYSSSTNNLGQSWPGLARNRTQRDLSQTAIENAVLLGPDDFKRFAEQGPSVTDDNQLLSYGRNRINRFEFEAGDRTSTLNLEFINRIRQQGK